MATHSTTVHGVTKSQTWLRHTSIKGQLEEPSDSSSWLSYCVRWHVLLSSMTVISQFLEALAKGSSQLCSLVLSVLHKKKLPWSRLLTFPTRQPVSRSIAAPVEVQCGRARAGLLTQVESFWRVVRHKGFPGGSDSKESACNAGGLGSTPRSGRSPGREDPLKGMAAHSSMLV